MPLHKQSRWFAQRPRHATGTNNRQALRASSAVETPSIQNRCVTAVRSSDLNARAVDSSFYCTGDCPSSQDQKYQVLLQRVPPYSYHCPAHFTGAHSPPPGPEACVGPGKHLQPRGCSKRGVPQPAPKIILVMVAICCDDGCFFFAGHL